MSYWRLHYHLVWATKNREPLIDEAKEVAIAESLQATCSRLGVKVHAVGIVPDHCHLAVSVPPTLTLVDVVRQLKGASSRAATVATGETFSWQSEYGALTFSDHGLNDLITYVQNQKQHHSDGNTFPGLERYSSGNPG